MAEVIPLRPRGLACPLCGAEMKATQTVRQGVVSMTTYQCSNVHATDNVDEACAANGHAYAGEDDAGPRCLCGLRREWEVDEAE